MISPWILAAQEISAITQSLRMAIVDKNFPHNGLLEIIVSDARALYTYALQVRESVDQWRNETKE